MRSTLPQRESAVANDAQTRDGAPTEHAPSRAIVERVQPEIDGGRFPIKRTVGETVYVSADVFVEGHDHLSALILHRAVGATVWNEAPLTAEGNVQGRHEYTIEAWVDRFDTWQSEVRKKFEARQDVASELLEGAALVRAAGNRATGHDAESLNASAAVLAASGEQAARVKAALDPELTQRMARYADRSRSTLYEPFLNVTVERERARFGAWYEMFPRSAASENGRHGTLKDTQARLPYIAGMGFDVLYLPPIHPIGRSFRKGPNNTLTPGPGDPGSPWAIGAAEGGHTAILSELGTLEDFDQLVAAARGFGIEIALDIAFQCSPDHPYVRDHPQWFRHRPDGTIKYAENPPKKYQDIYPIDFECDDWQALWNELRDVILFWVEHGVSIFRVDNPHTKPFRFWEWLIREVWDRHPDAIFLSEAFTRPKVMRYLAKAGFSQSYSYFTWRTGKAELTEYFTELTRTEVAEYMRPNLFANTPDILHESLQTGGRAVFQSRLVLAATLGATYGIYGPPFEQCVGTPIHSGSEEYLDSEKYQVRHWSLDAPGSIRDYVARVNAIRRENPALRFDGNLRFHHIENGSILAYEKATPDRANIIVTVVNLDPHHTQGGWLHLPIHEWGLAESYQVHDLIDDVWYWWRGEWNFVLLDPSVRPAHIFRIVK